MLTDKSLQFLDMIDNVLPKAQMGMYTASSYNPYMIEMDPTPITTSPLLLYDRKPRALRGDDDVAPLTLNPPPDLNRNLPSVLRGFDDNKPDLNQMNAGFGDIKGSLEPWQTASINMFRANESFNNRLKDVGFGTQDPRPQEALDPLKIKDKMKMPGLDDVLSVVPGAVQLGMGVYNMIEGAKEKKRIKKYDKALKEAQKNRFHEARLNDFYYTPYTVGRTTDRLRDGGGVPERYKNMGFDRVGQKKDSTRDGKKWMVLAKKGDDYKVVHGGYEGMEDYTQHRNDQRRENFWNRMGGKNSAKANDPFSPLHWHKKFGTWQMGGQTNSMDAFIDFYERDQAGKNMAQRAMLDTENQQLTQMQALNEQQRKSGLRDVIGGGLNIAANIFDPTGTASKILGATQKTLGMEKGGWIQDVNKSMEEDNTKGAFTRQAKTRGMTAQEFARKVLSNKENYDTKTIRRANLARTFAKMQLGGYYLDSQDMYGGMVEPNQYYYQDGGEVERDTENLYSPDFESPWQQQSQPTVDGSEQIDYTNYMQGDSFNDMSDYDMDLSQFNMPTSQQGMGAGYSAGLPEAVVPQGYYDQQRTIQGLMPGKQIATQHNNPGNIKYGQFAAKYGAVPGKRATDGGVFALFPSVEAGLEAHKNLLRTGKYYRNQSLDKAMRTWSGNGYGDNIVPHLRGKKISELTDEEFNQVMREQHRIESPEMYRILYGGK